MSDMSVVGYGSVVEYAVPDRSVVGYTVPDR